MFQQAQFSLTCLVPSVQCTGNSPCANCTKHNLVCTLNQAADKRRRGHMKRKIDLLEDKEDLLIGLVGILRESGNRRTIPLLNLIRSNASLAEIRHYIDHELPRGDLARTPELLEVCNEVQRLQQTESRSVRRILDAKRLSDIPRYRVPVGSWTGVTEDEDFVSHLVSLWFTWCHPFCNWVDRARFLADMRSGRGEYCSPFLVNVILADACVWPVLGPWGCMSADDAGIFGLSRSVREGGGSHDARIAFLRRGQTLAGQGRRPDLASDGAGTGGPVDLVSGLALLRRRS